VFGSNAVVAAVSGPSLSLPARPAACRSQAEQMVAYEENDGGRLPLTWAQTKRMPMTQLVSLRP